MICGVVFIHLARPRPSKTQVPAPALDCHGTSPRDPWIKGVAAGLDIQKESTPEG